MIDCDEQPIVRVDERAPITNSPCRAVAWCTPPLDPTQTASNHATFNNQCQPYLLMQTACLLLLAICSSVTKYRSNTLMLRWSRFTNDRSCNTYCKLVKSSINCGHPHLLQRQRRPFYSGLFISFVCFIS